MSDTKQNAIVTLRKTELSDLEMLFTHQLDNEYANMAAFVNEKWNDKEAYITKWTNLLADPTINIRTIIWDDTIVGSISTWPLGDELQLAYGLGKEYWNRGFVTSAVQQFLPMVSERPLYGRLAFDNIGSAKVLERCGFKKLKEDIHYSFARKKEIAEIVYILED